MFATHLCVLSHGTVRLRVTATARERGRGADVGGWWSGQLVLHFCLSVHLHGNQVFERLFERKEKAITQKKKNSQECRPTAQRALAWLNSVPKNTDRMRVQMLTVLLSCHFQSHVLLFELLIRLLQVADVVDGFPEDSRLVELKKRRNVTENAPWIFQL